MSNMEIKPLKCKRCGESWWQRDPSLPPPVHCAKCNSPYWSTKRKR